MKLFEVAILLPNAWIQMKPIILDQQIYLISVLLKPHSISTENRV